MPKDSARGTSEVSGPRPLAPGVLFAGLYGSIRVLREKMFSHAMSKVGFAPDPTLHQGKSPGRNLVTLQMFRAVIGNRTVSVAFVRMAALKSLRTSHAPGLSVYSPSYNAHVRRRALRCGSSCTGASQIYPLPSSPAVPHASTAPFTAIQPT